MAFQASLITVALLALCLALPAEPDERKDTEQGLNAVYGGQIARLRYSADSSDFRLHLPRGEQALLEPATPLYFLIDRVRIKRKEVEFEARRVYLYQDTDGKPRSIPAKNRKYRLEWKGQFDAIRLRESLSRTLILATPTAADLDGCPVPLKQPSTESALAPQGPGAEILPGVFRIGGPVTAPRCETCPDPVYTQPARDNNIIGVVKLWAILDESGRFCGIRVIEPLGYGLEQSAVLAAFEWRLKPALRDGKPVRVMMQIEVGFNLFQ